jgi:hypothetical protein
MSIYGVSEKYYNDAEQNQRKNPTKRCKKKKEKEAETE